MFGTKIFFETHCWCQKKIQFRENASMFQVPNEQYRFAQYTKTLNFQPNVKSIILEICRGSPITHLLFPTSNELRAQNVASQEDKRQLKCAAHC
ncbi:unnamed protein product [Ixodes persulcatus]